jgi:hypothetical protein
MASHVAGAALAGAARTMLATATAAVPTGTTAVPVPAASTGASSTLTHRGARRRAWRLLPLVRTGKARNQAIDAPHKVAARSHQSVIQEHTAVHDV